MDGDYYLWSRFVTTDFAIQSYPENYEIGRRLLDLSYDFEEQFNRTTLKMYKCFQVKNE